jgi:hypothetical protein
MVDTDTERRLEEKVYLICYQKPKWADEISKELWGVKDDRRSTLSKKDGPIRRLLNKGYIQEVLRPEGVTANRRYYLSTSKWLLDEIQRISNFEDSEIKRLSEIFESDFFKGIIIYDKNHFNNISLIINGISYLATQIKFTLEIVKKFRKTKSRHRLGKMVKRDLILYGIKEKNVNKLLKNGELIMTDMLKLKLSTINKLMKLSPHYQIRYYSFLGAFELGRNL